MQVANTFNNTIRILFNPKLEAFKLFDFLMVKSDGCKYIAQIIEIYDDKFDASQNVAKLKLFYQINQNNEVVPYDNFTPNKECEIIKVKQDEIENFINQDKETFIFGTNVKSQTALNLQYDFFNNNAIILADKVENANTITYNLAKNLSNKNNVVIIDQSGILDYEDAKKIKAGKNFRMPLNYSTIDHVFNKCLNDASLEFQAIGGEIINEIKRFAKKQESEFIPFNQLTKVLLQQYKATPYPELKLLLVRLKKYQMDEIFAKTKNDKDNLFKTIEKNKITIIDLSSIDSFWQKAYIDYIVSDVNQEIYLLTRVNDEHFDSDLINRIYNKKKNIKFVPNVSYNYKRLPSLAQHCKNYILMPSLFQRTDFLDANFALSNLISQDCVVFGENTDNFLYLACDYELEVQEKRKNYRKIALTLAQQDTENNIKQEIDTINDDNSAKIVEELNEFNSIQEASLQKTDEYIETNAPDEDFDEIENPSQIQVEEVQNQEDDLIFTDSINSSKSNQEDDEFQEIDNSQEQQNSSKNDESSSLIFKEEYDKENSEIKQDENENSGEVEDENSFEEDLIDISDEELDFFQMAQETSDEYDEIEEKVIENSEVEAQEEKKEEEQPTEAPQEEKDEEFKEILIQEETDENQTSSDIEEDKEESQVSLKEPDDEENNETENLNIVSEEINLAEIANNSIDENFEEIINKKNNQTTHAIVIDENIKLDENVIAQKTNKENLPIFKEENADDNSVQTFEIGDIIIHKKYGRGSVVKTIKYEDRQLLQIEFEQAGKKLLDPKVAEIELEQ